MIREDTYLFLDERVAVLHALDKAVCRHLASIGRWDWAALRRHVAGCAACAPGDHRRLRDRAEHGIGWPVVFGLTASRPRCRHAEDSRPVGPAGLTMICQLIGRFANARSAPN